MGRTVSPRGWQPLADERLRRERTLASVRATLALVLFAGILAGPISTPSDLPRLVLGAYLAFALAVLAAVRLRKGQVTWIARGSHVVDVCVGAGLLASTAPAASVVIVLALLGAAHRWGFRATIVTALASMLLSFAGPQAIAFVEGQSLPFARRDTLALVGSIGLIAVAIGYVARASDQLRSETETVAALFNHAEVRLGLKHSLAVVFDAVIKRFAARRAVFVVHEFSTDRIFVWQGGTLAGAHAEPLRVTRLDPRQFDAYLFPPSSAAWSVVRRGESNETLDIVGLDPDGNPTGQGPRAFSEPFLSTMGPFRHLLGIGVDRPGSWTGRLFIVDAPSRGDRVAMLGFAQRIVRHISPALDNVYLLHRLRSRSAANERARIGRELHDGIIQSVMGVQIQLHALAPLAGTRSRALADEMTRLSGLLHEQVLNLRDMMQQMKPLELAPDRFIGTLADAVQRFQCETGITARFITQHDRVDLPPRACRELARVVQEALVNIRKHSGAHNVFVRLGVSDGVCRLTVDDDGCGFPFTGRLSNAELDKHREGPRVIKERVRLLGGDIAVESVPTQGSRLDISIPLASTYAIAG